MINARLQSLRQYLASHKLDAIIVPSNDPHFSEYPPEYWEIRAWISGFTGSAGTVVVTADKSGLWTDSRYFIQAEQQLNDTEIVLHRVHDRSSPGITDWLINNLKPAQTVAVIDQLTSIRNFNSYQKALAKKDIKLTTTTDCFEQLWKDRPGLPKTPVYDHPINIVGVSRSEKLSIIRETMNAHGCSFHLVTTLDDIAWILNLRSADVPCNPVLLSYLLITDDKAILFVETSKFSDELQQILSSDNILIRNYNGISAELRSIPRDAKVLLDKSVMNLALLQSLDDEQLIDVTTPSVLMKACKNDTEIEHFRNAMVKDGIALTHAFHWLETQLKSENISEFDFGEKLAHFRSQQEDYHGESFNPIVGYKGNGAIVHYRAEKESAAEIKADGILLVDSGGQYIDGTTDITRTIALSTPTLEQKRCYTLVLKGMIALTYSKFPNGTTGVQLDTFARQYLWHYGYNFSHGTGHGVGFFNNVHEGPQGIAPSCNSRAAQVMLAGMVCSNEPGYYSEGEFGIRIENLILCIPSDNDGFLEFETLTLFPIDMTLVEMELLEKNEIDWLNNYHKKVFEKLSPGLNHTLKNWLADKCQSI